jgi:hypothetical protein
MATTTRRKSSAAKRTRLKNNAGAFFARRSKRGRFKELDEVGRSQRTDRRRKSKTRVRSGQGDKGDRRSS